MTSLLVKICTSVYDVDTTLTLTEPR